MKLLPLTATFIVSPILGSVLTQRLGPRPPVVAGMLLLAAAFFGLTGLAVDSAYSDVWPWSAQMPASLQQAITDAANAAFLHGLRTAMIVAGCLSIVGALLGLLVERGSEVDPVHAVAA